MTTVEKRKLIKFICRCVKHDLLLDADVNKILEICATALDREFKAKEKE